MGSQHGLLVGGAMAFVAMHIDRSHFQGYGESALNFETVYYVLGADYNLYMDIQQAINLEIFRRFKEEDISFAYPTRTIILQAQDENPQRQGQLVAQTARGQARDPDPRRVQ